MHELITTSARRTAWTLIETLQLACLPATGTVTDVVGDALIVDVNGLPGVFVDVGGVEGLLHPRDVVAVGARVIVHVVEVDHEHKLLTLSMAI